MPYTLSSVAGTVPDEDYIKPFLDRPPPSEEAPHAFQAICQYHQVLEPFNPDNIRLPPVEAISTSSQTVDHILFGDAGNSLPVDWSSLQQKEPVIGSVLSILHRAQSLDQLRSDSPVSVWMFRERSHLVLKDGVSYRRLSAKNGEKLQLVLPNSLKPPLLQGFHNVLGHLGRDKTLDLIRERFCWPRMEKDVNRHIASCNRCIKRKSPDPPRAPMVPILAREPMELLAIDFLSLEKGKGGFEHVLVVTNSFTRYSWAFPTHNQQASIVAKLLWEKILVNFSFPQQLHSGQGRDFESRIIKDLCKVVGIEKTRTTPYHLQWNGQSEWFNRTFLGMLGTLDADKKNNWPEFVLPLVHAYNCTRL